MTDNIRALLEQCYAKWLEDADPAKCDELIDAIRAELAKPVEKAEHGKRQYYYRNSECKAHDAQDPDCICWHDKGTGPFPEIPDGIRLVWRTAPTPTTAGHDALHGKYGHLLAPFVALMEAELRANAGKGDRPGWLAMTPEVGMLEIYDHAAKLQKAVKNSDIDRIREHAADVANISMMLLDLCGGLAIRKGE